MKVLREALEHKENSMVRLEPEERKYLLELLEEQRELSQVFYVVVVCHVNVVTIGHGLLMKFWPMVIGCVLRTARSSMICNYLNAVYYQSPDFLRYNYLVLIYYLTLTMSRCRFYIMSFIL